MSKTLSAFEPVPHHPGVWSAQKGALRCTALALRDGTLCLYSPVQGLGAAAQASLAAMGDVAYLLAPNHYHHKGLAEYAEAFPDARIVASDPARPRLAHQTGLALGGLQDLAAQLPEGCAMAQPDGLKTGEVWLVVGSPQERLWILCDCLKGPKGEPGHIGQRPEMLGTFPTYGIKDKQVYAAWITARAEADRPRMIVPCHGSMVRSAELARDVVALLPG